MPRLIVVEDHKKLLNSLRRGLEKEGYEVLPAATGEEGYFQATTQEVDAIVLDLMLPGRDGLEVLRGLRAGGFAKPVLILTARDAVEERVRGLDAGADDYLIKPFAFAELLARLRALLRRDHAGREMLLRADDLELDLPARRVVRAGVELDLTRREFELLEYLLRHKNTVVTRDMLARDVWKDPVGTTPKTIDVFVTLLRKKVERPEARQLLHTVRGVGYALQGRVMGRLSIRWRLTLWYGAVLATVLAAFGGAVYLMMRHVLTERVDVELGGELQEMVDDVEAAGGWPELERRWSRRFARRGGYAFQVDRMQGGALVRGDGLRTRGLPVPPVSRSLRHLDFESVPLGSRSVDLGPPGRWRAAAQLVPGPDGPVVVQVAAPLAPVEGELGELLMVLLLAGPLALAGALGGGYLLARKALDPVDRMAAAADQITATRLDRRLDVPVADDELGRLARTLNGMIARLERSFDEVRRFTADAAHELRTPLAVLRNVAEVALRDDRDPERDRRAFEDILEEAEWLGRLAEQLLFLSREDAGLGAVPARVVRLDEVVQDVGESLRIVAREQGQSLAVEACDPCPVLGDEGQLRRLLANLLDNAIKYTPVGGSITARAECRDGRAVIVVADTGVGIAAEHLERVFERFYRVDPARGRETEGTGLGLAICRAIAEAHGGEIQIESITGRGTRVIVTLPAASEEPASSEAVEAPMTPAPDLA